MRIDARIAKAKAAPSLLVNVAVWVMKPGPMADVAIRKIAATSAARRDFADMPDGGGAPLLGEIADCSMNPLLFAGAHKLLGLAHINFIDSRNLAAFHNSVNIVQRLLFHRSIILLKC
jgi:hypothetical protein